MELEDGGAGGAELRGGLRHERVVAVVMVAAAMGGG